MSVNQQYDLIPPEAGGGCKNSLALTLRIQAPGHLLCVTQS